MKKKQGNTAPGFNALDPKIIMLPKLLPFKNHIYKSFYTEKITLYFEQKGFSSGATFLLIIKGVHILPHINTPPF